jgi:hypothetical protein
VWDLEDEIVRLTWIRVAAVVAPVLIVVAVIAVITTRASPDEVAVAPLRDVQPSIESRAQTARLTSERARSLEDAVNRRSAAAIVDAVVLGKEDDPADVARKALPDGAELRIAEDTFTPLDEDGYASVDATVEGTTTADVVLLLVRDADRWRIAGSTEPRSRS